jgi:hypothetical protein
MPLTLRPTAPQRCQGDHHPVTVREMRRTPRGAQWYAKSVSNLLARACVI